MLRLVVGDKAISNPVEAVNAFGKYTGADVQLVLDGTPHPVTFIQSSATGDKGTDELQLTFLWGYDSPKEFSMVYDDIRSDINNLVRVKLGREEFSGILTDTTKVPVGADVADAFEHKFYLTFSGVRPVVSGSAVTAKKHSSSIVEVVVPENVWAHICKNVPEASKLEDPPHITLLCMQDLPKDKLDTIKTTIEGFCSSYAPFQVNVTGSGKFPSDKAKVPHYAAIKSLDLVKFRDALAEKLAEIDPDLVDLESFPGFVPHMTVQYVDADTKLPVIKPISWMVRDISLSYKGDEKFLYPLGKVASLHGFEPKKPYNPLEKAASLDIVTSESLVRLASKISTKLTSLGYEQEALKIATTAEVLGKKKKKPSKDTSVDHFTSKLKKQLSQYVSTHHLDFATDSVLRLLMDDSHDSSDSSDVEDSESPSDGDFGGDAGGDSGGGAEGAGGEVEGLGPHMEGVDPHIMTRMKGIESVRMPSGAPEGNKAVPFMERNYAAELRTWLRRNHPQ